MTKINNSAGYPGSDPMFSVMQQVRDLQAKKPPVTGKPASPASNSTAVSDNRRFATDGVEREPSAAVHPDENGGAHKPQPAPANAGRRPHETPEAWDRMRELAKAPQPQPHAADNEYHSSFVPGAYMHFTREGQEKLNQFSRLTAAAANNAGPVGSPQHDHAAALLDVVKHLADRALQDRGSDRVMNALKNISSDGGQSVKTNPIEALKQAISDLWSDGVTQDLNHANSLPADARPSFADVWASRLQTALTKAGVKASDFAPATSSTEPPKPATAATAPVSSTLSSLLNVIEALRSMLEAMATQKSGSQPPFGKKPAAAAHDTARPQPATDLILKALAPILDQMRQLQAQQAAFAESAAPAATGRLAAFDHANERTSAPNAHAAGASANAAFNVARTPAQGSASTPADSLAAFEAQVAQLPGAQRAAFTEIVNDMRRSVAMQEAFARVAQPAAATTQPSAPKTSSNGATGAYAQVLQSMQQALQAQQMKMMPPGMSQANAAMDHLVHSLESIRDLLTKLVAALHSNPLQGNGPAQPVHVTVVEPRRVAGLQPAADSAPAPVSAPRPEPAISAHPAVKHHHRHHHHDVKSPMDAALEKLLERLDSFSSLLQKLVSALTPPASPSQTGVSAASNTAPSTAAATPANTQAQATLPLAPPSKPQIAMRLTDEIEALLKKLLSDPAVTGTGSGVAVDPKGWASPSQGSAQPAAPTTDAYEAVLKSMLQAKEQMENVQDAQVASLQQEVHNKHHKAHNKHHKQASQAHAMDSSRR